MVCVISLPPIRLANSAEDQLPSLITFLALIEQEALHHFACPIFLHACGDIFPSLFSNLFPIKRGEDFE
jgi:hypothetical protein